MQEVNHLVVDEQSIFDFHQITSQENQQQNSVGHLQLNLWKVEMDRLK
jgi:hypothetical protein